MDWINLNVAVLDSEPMVGAEPIDRATWLFLTRFCCGQENGGRIRGARSWGDRRWQQVCRVTLAEVQRECALWRWEGDDLVVAFYFAEKEGEVQRLRSRASAAANARWKQERNAIGHASSMPQALPDALPDQPASNAEEKRIEENGREGAAPPPPSHSQRSKIETAAILAAFGLPSSPTDCREWAGGLGRVAHCRSRGEAHAFVAWAIETCRAQGVTVEHFRTVRRLAVEWDEGQRLNHWSAA